MNCCNLLRSLSEESWHIGSHHLSLRFAEKQQHLEAICTKSGSASWSNKSNMALEQDWTICLKDILWYTLSIDENAIARGVGPESFESSSPLWAKEASGCQLTGPFPDLGDWKSPLSLGRLRRTASLLIGCRKGANVWKLRLLSSNMVSTYIYIYIHT